MSGGLILADGEREVVSAPAVLLGRAPASRGGAESAGVGVPPPRADLAEDVAGDRSPDAHTLEVIDEGDLVKTDRRIAFIGKDHRIEVQFPDLVAWHLEGALLRIRGKGDTEPFLFELRVPHHDLYAWIDDAVDPAVPIDPGYVGRWIQPGFPSRILLDDEELVVDADALLPFAAAVLDMWPTDRHVDGANALGIDEARAIAILQQLEALGITSRLDAEGERDVFDPDGRTIPLGSLEAAREGGDPHREACSPCHGAQDRRVSVEVPNALDAVLPCTTMAMTAAPVVIFAAQGR